MKAIILCAGKGTRLPEVSKIIPKVMVEISGKPLLLRHIEQLKKYGVNEIGINLYHKGEMIVDYFGDGEKFGVKITYSHEAELLGTGGALVPFERFIDDDTVVLYGDVLQEIDFSKMLKFHKGHGGVITAAMHPSAHPADSDLIEFDRNFKVKKILKVPHAKIPREPYNLAALYLFSSKIKQYLNMPLPFDIAHDLLPKLLGEKQGIYGYNTGELMMDVGTPERLQKAHKLFKK